MVGSKTGTRNIWVEARVPYSVKKYGYAKKKKKTTVMVVCQTDTGQLKELSVAKAGTI